MSTPRSRKKLFAWLVGGALFVAVATMLINADRSDVGQVRRLADGSTLLLREAVFTATNYNFTHQRGSKFLRLIAPVLPSAIRSRFNVSRGRLGFGLDGTSSNLIVITVNRDYPQIAGWGSTLGRLCVADEQGNSYDACWGASSIGYPGETVHGWQVRAFPRRSRMINLRFLAADPIAANRIWTNAAEFQIPNALYAQYPQWTPEPWPVTKSDGNLAVTLSEFQCGARMSGLDWRGDESVAAHKTRVVVSFAEEGRKSDDWRVQKLTISDATGNRWFPYLDFVEMKFNSTSNGTVEFLGALWAGEQAWKLEVEAVRARGFKPEELWEVPLALPAAGTVVSLTNRWEHDDAKVGLVALASPNADHAGDFEWIAKWWGEDRSKVYSLALEWPSQQKGWRLTVVRVVDQNGRDVKVVHHGNQDHSQQAVFFKPADDATAVRLTLALQRSRFVEFLARPEFVTDSASRRASEPADTNKP